MILLLEWFAREGHLLLAWWLWITLAGFAVFPICFCLLGGLPDRGYTLARAVGLLLIAFVYWLMASYGFFENARGNIILAWGLVLIGGLIFFARRASRGDLAAWWRDNWRLALLTEVLFAALFVGWAIYRAHQNGITGTEKPMELAFMSATQRSPSFPPQDPWMSGYAISYYYLGYVMSSMLSMMSGITSSIAFNLNSASQFALTGLSAFGVACNLARSRGFQRRPALPRLKTPGWVAAGAGLVALLLMTVVGNFQLALIEIPYETRAASETYLDFWGTDRRSNFAEGAYVQQSAASLSSLDTAMWEHWWWWPASRVLTDYNLDNSLGSPQPIAEFPAFSFLLADNHPHVLALPFTIMFIALMLNLVLAYRRPQAGEIALYGLAIGGIAFLNAWDGPIYWMGLVGAEGLRRLLLNDRGRLTVADIVQALSFGLRVAAIALIAYLPYLIGFRSQASGLLPNLINPSAIQRYFVVFGPLLMPLAAYLVVEAWRGGVAGRMNWRLAAKAVALIFGGLALLMLLLTLAAAASPQFSQASRILELAGGLGPGLAQALGRHIERGWTALILLLGMLVVIGRLFPPAIVASEEDGQPRPRVTYAPAGGFALLLIGMGLCLTLAPQFVYLRDNFGGRINTVFKLYYQAWTLWSIAAAYAAYSILYDRAVPRPRAALRLVFAAAFAISMLAGLMYTVLGVHHRARVETGRHRTENIYTAPPEWENPIRHVAEGAVVEAGAILYSDGRLNDAAQSSIIQSYESGIVENREGGIGILQPLTLDGWDSYVNPWDLEVVGCLRDLVGRGDAVVAEAVRDAYQAAYGRVGALTGIPIVLGWVNHERQWRGPTYGEIVGTREQDMDALYSAVDMNEVEEIIDRYQIDYILFGWTERAQFGDLGEALFIDYFPIVCEAGDSRVYATGRVDA